MLTKERNDSSVVATSPFLDLQQTAGELRTTVTHVMRLVARGFLLAVQAGDNWRIRPADLDFYARNGSPDFDAPKFDSQGNWFGDNENHGFASAFQTKVREILLAAFPAELPRDNRGKPVTRLQVTQAGQLSDLARAPAFTSGIVITGEKPYVSRFDLAAEQYAADRIRQNLKMQLQQRVSAKERRTCSGCTRHPRNMGS